MRRAWRLGGIRCAIGMCRHMKRRSSFLRCGRWNHGIGVVEVVEWWSSIWEGQLGWKAAR